MNNNGFRILIVDDEPNIRNGLAKGLTSEADEVVTAKDGTDALDLFRKHHHHLVITDLKMPGSTSGLDLVKQIKHESPETLVLVITAHGSVETAVEAMRDGAHDYISKPVDLNMLRLLVRNAYEHHRLMQENRELRNLLATPMPVSRMPAWWSGAKRGWHSQRCWPSTLWPRFVPVARSEGSYAQYRKRFSMGRLDRYDPVEGCWREAVVEDYRTPVADQAWFRIDFPAWLKTLPRRDRKIAKALAEGHRTTDVARRFGLSMARISQLRRELYDSWQQFHSEENEEEQIELLAAA
jgi:DNA-binding NarL/FixJ family response regulator